MEDKITWDRINQIHPMYREELKQIYKEICIALPGKIGCRFVQVFRSFAEQHAIFLQIPKVSNAEAGQSYHNYGLAVDFCLIEDKNGDGKISGNEIIWTRNTDLDKDSLFDWMEVVKVFTKYGWKWGASFGDYPHFEKSKYNWRKLFTLHKDKNNFIPNTAYLKEGLIT